MTPALNNAPKALRDLYAKTLADLVADGYATAEAESIALRMVQHAGWYQTASGWKQLGPDVRNKVNVRKAHRQADGRFLIQDVDIFYPNAVKSRDGNIIAIDADMIRELIDNTQKNIAQGGQRPTLTRTHIRPEQKASGTVVPACGSGQNFRESPRGKGWARCDLVDVEPEAVDAWKRGKITGLSVGFNADANGLNQRFGHIAALGGEPQALSRLPRTEVFAAEDQLCFSADSAFYGAINMKHAILKPHLDALSAAYAAAEAGEPGADDKLQTAHKGYCNAMTEFSGAETIPGVDVAAAKAPEVAGAAFSAGDLEGVDFAADPEAAFKRVLGTVKHLAGTVGVLTAENTTLKKGNARSQFSTYLDGLKKDGLQFSADEAMSMYDVIGENEVALGSFKKMIEKSPKLPSLAGKEIFSSDEANTPAGSKPIDKTADPKTADRTTRARQTKESLGGVAYASDDGSSNFEFGEQLGSMIEAETK